MQMNACSCASFSKKISMEMASREMKILQFSIQINLMCCLLKTFMLSLYFERVLNHVPLRGHFRHLTRMIINLRHDKKIQKLCVLVWTLILEIVSSLIIIRKLFLSQFTYLRSYLVDGIIFGHNHYQRLK